MTRRAEEDYTAHEIEERWGREQVVAHPVFGGGPRLACGACCNTPDDLCICATPGDSEFRDAMRRARRRSTDYRPTGDAA